MVGEKSSLFVDYEMLVSAVEITEGQCVILTLHVSFCKVLR